MFLGLWKDTLEQQVTRNVALVMLLLLLLQGWSAWSRGSCTADVHIMLVQQLD